MNKTLSKIEKIKKLPANEISCCLEKFGRIEFLFRDHEHSQYEKVVKLLVGSDMNYAITFWGYPGHKTRRIKIYK